LLGGELVKPEEVELLCQLLAELSQLNSECLEAALRKHAPQSFSVVFGEDVELSALYDVGGDVLMDSDDGYRLSWFARRMSTATTLAMMRTDGLVEDFLRTWCGVNDREESFDPDSDVDLLLESYV
jgi:hypothetical protein